MDSLKLYGRHPDQLKGLLHTVCTFSDAIHMKFGLDKCAVAHFVNGKLSGHNSWVTVEITNTINCLERGQIYKYLGVDESNGIQHSSIRGTLRREYTFVELRWFSRPSCTVGTRFWPSTGCSIGSYLSMVLVSFIGGPHRPAAA